MLDRLTAHALIEDRDDPGVLAHGTFSRKLQVAVDASLIFGDFYYMDALARCLRLPYADYLLPPH